jgi:long-chain acyl-CoA synthetase
MAQTILDMLEGAASRFGRAPYVARKGDQGWTARSFREVDEDSDALAARLLDLGLRRNQPVAILSEGSPHWVIGEFGILKAGAVSVPLSIQLLPKEIQFRLEHSEAWGVLVSHNQLEKLLTALGGNRGGLKLIYLEELKEEKAAENLSRHGSELLVYDRLLAEGRELLRNPESRRRLATLRAEVGPEDVATISYTSGTTGNPKGIMLTHRNYYANCHDAVTMFDVPQDFRTLVILPCDHSFAHTVAIYAGLLRGISLYFVDGRGGPTGMLRSIPLNLQETNPSFLLTIPALSGSFMKKIKAGVAAKGGFVDRLFTAGVRNGVRYHGDGFRRSPLGVRLGTWLPYKLAQLLVFGKVRRSAFGARIRFCVGGGALLDVRQQEFFKALGVPVYQGYGLTEAAPVISSNTPLAHKLGSSGRLAPSVQCRILTSDGREARTGEKGEIVVQGENVMKGYYKNPVATAEALREGWLFTGDLGYLDEDGFLYVVGREKALLIAEDGEKYSPEEIEEAIANSSPLIAQIMIYNDHRRYTVALIVIDAEQTSRALREKGGVNLDAALLQLKESFYLFQSQAAYRDRFPSRWIPNAFQVLPEPFTVQNQMLNSTLKVVRHQVTEVYGELLEYMYTPEGSVPLNPRNREALRALLQLE